MPQAFVRRHPPFCLLMLSVGVVAASTTIPLPANAADRPNIVFILADDVGQGCLGCYGGQSYRTPHLDNLAKTGMRFRHCYSMPMCHPTRLTLMTGKYPFRHGDVSWGSFPKSGEPRTFSRILAESGYATAVFGKWQLALLRDVPDHPNRLGFQHCDVFGWHEGPRYYEPMIYRNGKVRDDTLGHYGPDLYVRSLIEFIKRNRDQPFLAYFPMALCHDVTDDLDAPVPHGPLGRYDSFAEMVEEMDRSIGRIVAALNALHLREQTLILYVGDNGTPQRMILRAEGQRLFRVPVVSRQNGINVRGGKGTLTDTGTRVPLIANWPGTVGKNQVVDDLVDMSDFLPTLAELAGVNLPVDQDPDGVSLVPRLVHGRASSRQWAYSEAKGSRWVRTARWKLYDDGRLIDMESDRTEVTPMLEPNDTAAMRRARKQLCGALESLEAKSIKIRGSR